jgi:hypothetical protein
LLSTCFSTHVYMLSNWTCYTIMCMCALDNIH